jgi:hypothetical protein
VKRLARLGRRAVQLATDPAALNKHLMATEVAVWDAFDIDDVERRVAIARLAGPVAPEGLLRYQASATEPPMPRSRFRRVGAVLGLEGDLLRLWVNGVTPEEAA